MNRNVRYSTKRIQSITILLLFAVLPVNELRAQQDPAAMLKQTMAANQKKLAQYQWIETTTVSLKGDVKSQTQKACHYGPDGKVQKQQISAPPQQQAAGGLKGRIIAKKKEEMTEYMHQAVALIHEYVPPDPQRIDAAKNAGNVALKPGAGGGQLEIRNYLKPGDVLGITLANSEIQKIHVGTYLDSAEDAITLDVGFASLADGTSHPSQTVLVASKKNLQVVIENANYQKMMTAGETSTPANFSVQQLDQLTAPIALYPDALVGQILMCSTIPQEVTDFAAWMEKNSKLQGSALQDAAKSAGFDTSFVAIAPFPQVVQLMAHDINWTTQLGHAFTADKSAVFGSIQRLRAQAQSAGNLKTTSQQQVTTQATSSGQQVIVIQPTNSQVVYVPTYNPQTVYVQSSSTYAGAGAVAFTTGVIIGAAASNNYYYGPYGWNAAAMYDEAWDRREDYADDRADAYQNNSNYRQNQYQQNASQRQATAQGNQTQRQSTAQGNQAQRQSAAQTNQSQRQTSAANAQSGAQANQATRQSSMSAAQGNAQTNQAARQSSMSTAQGGRQASAASSQRASSAMSTHSGGGQWGGSAARGGTSSGGFSGFQGTGQTRAESARGSRSLGGGGGGGSRGGRRGR